MPFVMSMHWPEVALEQYEQARREVGWETDFSSGGLLHVAYWAEDGFHAVDVWNSPEEFQVFSETRLAPVIQRMGMQTQPNVTFSPMHAIHNAAVALAKGAAKNARPARRAKKARPKKAAKTKKAKATKTSAKKRNTR